MADIDLTVYQVSRAGTAAVDFTTNHTNAVAGNTYKFVNNGRVVIIAAPTAALTAIGVVTQATVDSKAVADDALTGTNGKTQVWGPWPPAIYNDAYGKVSVTVDQNTDLMAVRVP